MVAVSRLRSLPCFSNIWRGYYLLSPLRKPLWLVLTNFIQKIYVHISMNRFKVSENLHSTGIVPVTLWSLDTSLGLKQYLKIFQTKFLAIFLQSIPKWKLQRKSGSSRSKSSNHQYKTGRIRTKVINQGYDLNIVQWVSTLLCDCRYILTSIFRTKWKIFCDL